MPEPQKLDMARAAGATSYPTVQISQASVIDVSEYTSLHENHIDVTYGTIRIKLTSEASGWSDVRF